MNRLVGMYLVAMSLSLTCGAQGVQVIPISTIPIDSLRVSSEGVLNVDPGDPGHIIATFLTADPTERPLDYYTENWESYDGGLTWIKLPARKANEAADPWALINEDGSFLVVDISEGSKFHLKTEVYDKGDWGRDASLGLGHDHAMTIKGDIAGELFLISTQKKASGESQLYWSKSTDDGRTFSRPVIHQFLSGVEFSVKQPILDDKGHLKIPVVVRARIRDGEKLDFEKMTTWLLRLNPEGTMIGAPEFLTENAGAKHHILMENRKNELLYAYTNTSRSQLQIIRSKRSGEWSDPLQINDPEKHGTWVNLDAVAVNQDNVMVIIWTSKKGDLYQKYFSVSRNGGSDFDPPKPLSTAYALSGANDWVGRAWPQGGDYCGLKAHPDGGFYVLWSKPNKAMFKPHLSKIIIK